MRSLSLHRGLAALALLLLAGCPGEQGSSLPPKTGAAPPASGAPADQPPANGGGGGAAADPELLKWAQRTLAVLPAEVKSKKNPVTPEKVALGRMLYFETRLSPGKDVSCATCHDLGRHGTDPRPDNAISKGPGGGTRNAPTVFNAAFQTSQFWDAREGDVESATKAHLTDPMLMGMADEAAVTAALKAIPGYAEPFAKAFPGDDPITFDAVGKAIGAYLRRLITPGRFDEFLQGKPVLTALELEGLNEFKQANCNMCHISELVGGNMSQKFGLQPSGWPGHPDSGQMFKVAQLRNVAKTGPWLHDGSIAKLDEVVKQMAKHQLGKDLSPRQVEAIVAFLEALSCEPPPAELTAKPDLPP